MRMLLTGFEPFNGSKMNPSEQAACRLHQQVVSGAEIHALILPVDWLRAPEMLVSALRTLEPQAVLCLGESGGRAALSVERLAVNLLDFRIPDNSGASMIDQPVLEGGPAAYFVTLPARQVCHAIRAAGVPAELSLTAGAYLCNQVLYHLLHFQAQSGRDFPAGFIHLPRLPEQAAEAGAPPASMSLETILTGVRAALDCIVATLRARPEPA